MRRAIPILAAVAVCAPLAAAPAGAAQLTEIRWDVTGGTFDGFFASGPITGGTASWRPAAGTLSTPTTNALGYLALTLTGPSGYFRAPVSPPPELGFFADITSGGFSGGASFGSASAYTSSLATPTFYQRATVSCPVPCRLTSSAGTIHFLPVDSEATHAFTLGNEVRTAVPEPGGPTLPALGLLVLLAAGAARSRPAARAHRR